MAIAPPAGLQWVYEIKHDGYRLPALLVRKSAGDRVRIYTRPPRRRLDQAISADWGHGPEAQGASFYLDREGVIFDERGLAVFDRLHGKGEDDACFLFAFDLLESTAPIFATSR